MISSFKNAALEQNGTLRKIPWVRKFVVQEYFEWRIDYFDESKWRVIIPAWFATNFWSIPRILTWVYDPCEYLAYVLHDYLYSDIAVVTMIDGTTRVITREEADNILLEAIQVEGMSKILAYPVYWWVRIGWSPNYHTDADNKDSPNS